MASAEEEVCYGFVDVFKAHNETIPYQTYQLFKRCIKVGRDHCNEIRIHNLKVSRLQCVISITGEAGNYQVRLENKTDKRTTFYKNEPVPPKGEVEIFSGDRFRCHEMELQYRDNETELEAFDDGPRTPIIKVTEASPSSSKSRSSSDRPSTSRRIKGDLRVNLLRKSVRTKDISIIKKASSLAVENSVAAEEDISEVAATEASEGSSVADPSIDEPIHEDFVLPPEAFTPLPLSQTTSAVEQDLILLSPIVAPQVENSTDLICFGDIEQEMFKLHNEGNLQSSSISEELPMEVRNDDGDLEQLPSADVLEAEVLDDVANISVQPMETSAVQNDGNKLTVPGFGQVETEIEVIDIDFDEDDEVLHVSTGMIEGADNSNEKAEASVSHADDNVDQSIAETSVRNLNVFNQTAEEQAAASPDEQGEKRDVSLELETSVNASTSTPAGASFINEVSVADTQVIEIAGRDLTVQSEAYADANQSAGTASMMNSPDFSLITNLDETPDLADVSSVPASQSKVSRIGSSDEDEFYDASGDFGLTSPVGSPEENFHDVDGAEVDLVGSSSPDVEKGKTSAEVERVSARRSTSPAISSIEVQNGDINVTTTLSESLSTPRSLRSQRKDATILPGSTKRTVPNAEDATIMDITCPDDSLPSVSILGSLRTRKRGNSVLEDAKSHAPSRRSTRTSFMNTTTVQNITEESVSPVKNFPSTSAHLGKTREKSHDKETNADDSDIEEELNNLSDCDDSVQPVKPAVSSNTTIPETQEELNVFRISDDTNIENDLNSFSGSSDNEAEANEEVKKQGFNKSNAQVATNLNTNLVEEIEGVEVSQPEPSSVNVVSNAAEMEPSVVDEHDQSRRSPSDAKENRVPENVLDQADINASVNQSSDGKEPVTPTPKVAHLLEKSVAPFSPNLRAQKGKRCYVVLNRVEIQYDVPEELLDQSPKEAAHITDASLPQTPKTSQALPKVMGKATPKTVSNLGRQVTRMAMNRANKTLPSKIPTASREVTKAHNVTVEDVPSVADDTAMTIDSPQGMSTPMVATGEARLSNKVPAKAKGIPANSTSTPRYVETPKGRATKRSQLSENTEARFEHSLQESQTEAHDSSIKKVSRTLRVPKPTAEDNEDDDIEVIEIKDTEIQGNATNVLEPNSANTSSESVPINPCSVVLQRTRIIMDLVDEEPLSPSKKVSFALPSEQNRSKNPTPSARVTPSQRFSRLRTPGTITPSANVSKPTSSKKLELNETPRLGSKIRSANTSAISLNESGNRSKLRTTKQSTPLSHSVRSLRSESISVVYDGTADVTGESSSPRKRGKKLPEPVEEEEDDEVVSGTEADQASSSGESEILETSANRSKRRQSKVLESPKKSIKKSKITPDQSRDVSSPTQDPSPKRNKRNETEAEEAGESDSSSRVSKSVSNAEEQSGSENEDRKDSPKKTTSAHTSPKSSETVGNQSIRSTKRTRSTLDSSRISKASSSIRKNQDAGSEEEDEEGSWDPSSRPSKKNISKIVSDEEEAEIDEANNSEKSGNVSKKSTRASANPHRPAARSPLQLLDSSMQSSKTSTSMKSLRNKSAVEDMDVDEEEEVNTSRARKSKKNATITIDESDSSEDDGSPQEESNRSKRGTLRNVGTAAKKSIKVTKIGEEPSTTSTPIRSLRSDDISVVYSNSKKVTRSARKQPEEQTRTVPADEPIYSSEEEDQEETSDVDEQQDEDQTRDEKGNKESPKKVSKSKRVSDVSKSSENTNSQVSSARSLRSDAVSIVYDNKSPLKSDPERRGKQQTEQAATPKTKDDSNDEDSETETRELPRGRRNAPPENKVNAARPTVAKLPSRGAKAKAQEKAKTPTPPSSAESEEVSENESAAPKAIIPKRNSKSMTIEAAITLASTPEYRPTVVVTRMTRKQTVTATRAAKRRLASPSKDKDRVSEDEESETATLSTASNPRSNKKETRKKEQRKPEPVSKESSEEEESELRRPTTSRKANAVPKPVLEESSDEEETKVRRPTTRRKANRIPECVAGASSTEEKQEARQPKKNRNANPAPQESSEEEVQQTRRPTRNRNANPVPSQDKVVEEPKKIQKTLRNQRKHDTQKTVEVEHAKDKSSSSESSVLEQSNSRSKRGRTDNTAKPTKQAVEEDQSDASEVHIDEKTTEKLMSKKVPVKKSAAKKPATKEAQSDSEVEEVVPAKRATRQAKQVVPEIVNSAPSTRNRKRKSSNDSIEILSHSKNAIKVVEDKATPSTAETSRSTRNRKKPSDDLHSNDGKIEDGFLKPAPRVKAVVSKTKAAPKKKPVESSDDEDEVTKPGPSKSAKKGKGKAAPSKVAPSPSEAAESDQDSIHLSETSSIVSGAEKETEKKGRKKPAQRKAAAPKPTQAKKGKVAPSKKSKEAEAEDSDDSDIQVVATIDPKTPPTAKLRNRRNQASNELVFNPSKAVGKSAVKDVTAAAAVKFSAVAEDQDKTPPAKKSKVTSQRAAPRKAKEAPKRTTRSRR